MRAYLHPFVGPRYDVMRSPLEVYLILCLSYGPQHVGSSGPTSV